MFQKSLLFVCLFIGINFATSYDYGKAAMIQNIKYFESKIKNNPKASEKCIEQYNLWKALIIEGPVMTDNWGWRMLDSWDKINTGILTGNILGLGQMDECLAIDETYKEVDIKGQYCYSSLPIPLDGGEAKSDNVAVQIETQLDRFRNMMAVGHGHSRGKQEEEEEKEPTSIYYMSICIPHECNWMKILGVNQTQDFELCQTKDTLKDYDAGDWAFVVFFIIVVMVVLMSSCYDWFIRHHNKKPVHPVTLAFSFYTNSEKLLRVSNNPEQMQSLNGIRVLSMAWVLTGHRFSASTINPLVNMEQVREWMQSTRSFYVTSAPVAVDSFFFLTGIVMAYGFMRSQSKPKARFNIILYYLHRYLRLTPALAVMYFFYVTVYKHVFSGPMQPLYQNMEVDNCLNNALSYFLYIQNIINPDRNCLGHTWYLSVDMQLFIISPLILLPMVKFPKYAGYGLVGLILLSILPAALVTYFMDIISTHPDYIKHYYAQPYTRMSPWLVGLLLGYIFYQLRDRKIKINWLINLCIWIAILVGMFFILYFAPEASATTNVSAYAVYNGFHRLCWALGLMWIVFACEKGYGGIVNWFLTLPLFQVLARLTYSMYLLHVLVQIMAVLRKRAPSFFDDYDMLNQAFGDIIVVSFLAFFYCMMFESPMVVIEKFIFGPNGYINKLFGHRSNAAIEEEKNSHLSKVTSQNADTTTAITLENSSVPKADTVAN